jgi:hypothetical protein
MIPPDDPTVDRFIQFRDIYENFIREFRDLSGDNLAAGNASVVNHAANTVLPLTVTDSCGYGKLPSASLSLSSVSHSCRLHGSKIFGACQYSVKLLRNLHNNKV